MCKNEETLDHLLFNPFSASILNQFLHQLNLTNLLSKIVALWTTWRQHAIKEKKWQISWHTLASGICWSLWLECNRRYSAIWNLTC